MPTYVAMVRGINVGPGKIVKMERLRASFEALGFAGVRTYVKAATSFLNRSKSRRPDYPRRSKKNPARLRIYSVCVGEDIERNGANCQR